MITGTLSLCVKDMTVNIALHQKLKRHCNSQV